MEDILKELIRENIPKYDTFENMSWALFVARIDEANIYDLFQQITFDKIMGQKKLLRFAQIKELPNVFEYPTEMAGTWKQQFNNEHPILLELACGRGEYTVGLAAMFPLQNFIGIDVKGNRMYLGAKKCNF
jgi:hypothetical protein